MCDREEIMGKRTVLLTFFANIFSQTEKKELEKFTAGKIQKKNTLLPYKCSIFQ